MVSVVCPHCLFTVMWQLYWSQARMKRKRGDQVSICIKGNVTERVWSCVHSVRVSWIPDLFVLRNNIAEPMYLKPISLSCFTPSFHGAPFYFFYSVGLHRLHLLSTLRGLQNKAEKICSACEGWKVTLGDDRGTKKWRKRGGEKERVRQRGGEISRERGMGGGIKLALGHLMTNNGTAPHHCRKPARKKGGKTVRKRLHWLLCFLRWPCWVSQYYTVKIFSHLVIR